MKAILITVFVLCSTLAHASFLPYFADLRTAVVERQVAISNAPPISVAGKKELNALKVALRTIDKPSPSLKTDLSALAAVTAGLNKGASNEVFAFQLRTAVSNYVGVLIATNDTLTAALTNANNNPALKAKAVALRDAAVIALASLNPETNLNGAAKGLGAVLTKYLVATKAVLVAVNAKPAPLPAPKAGKLVVEVDGQLYTFGAQFFIRNDAGTSMVGKGVATNSSSQLTIFIPLNGHPGNYNWSFGFSDTANGRTIALLGGGTSNAVVTAVSAGALAGTIEGSALVVISGVSTNLMPFKCRFNGKKFSFGI